jgi:hypothetical protein
MPFLSTGWVCGDGSPSFRRGRGLVVVATSFAFGHLTLDVRLLPTDTGSLAPRPFVHALQSLAFTLRRRALAFVRAQLSLVCQLLAIVCDSVPLTSDPISLVSEPLASRELSLTPREGLLALIEFGSPAIELTGHVGTVLSNHDSP